MRGYWTDETKQLALDVAKGNAGALRVIDELMWFTRWAEMMKWCKDNLSGTALWEKYKDECNCDYHRLGVWIEKEMFNTIKPIKKVGRDGKRHSKIKRLG
jgi:hypothetical protein